MFRPRVMTSLQKARTGKARASAALLPTAVQKSPALRGFFVPGAPGPDQIATLSAPVFARLRFAVMTIAAIVGLGNPGSQYAATRHNVGWWLLDRVAARTGASFKTEKKVLGEVAQVSLAYHNLRLLRPATFMNESGQAVRRLLDFYKLETEQLLVLHDELDLPPGTNRLKTGGGHGGHNGLRDIIRHCGKDFVRLRIGIGHPGEKSKVTGFVLRAPGNDEQRVIEAGLPDAERAIELALSDGLEKAMHFLHS